MRRREGRGDEGMKGGEGRCGGERGEEMRE